TASGAGYGLLVWLALTALFHGPAANWRFAAAGLILALALITAGLVSSTFHLGRPERAWRSFSQWRSSWLSREGVFAVATYPAALLFGLLWLQVVPWPAALRPAAVLTILLCIITVYCTAKIYSSLPTIRQWQDPFVDIGYLVLALATGAVLLALLAALFGLSAPIIGRLAAASLIAAAICKLIYWRRIDTAPPRHTIEEATGLGFLGKVRQWEAPHTGTNFVMKEMGYAIARKHSARLRSHVLAALPMAAATVLAASLVTGSLAVALAVVAVICAGLGVLIERWLFFAEAQHVVTLYYGAPAA
ncbi:MAG: dimethyl sulfoxide reductase anchor subunit family protein, partial [Aestuariivirgaceae bacterium]